jgi:hypothetical protein
MATRTKAGQFGDFISTLSQHVSGEISNPASWLSPMVALRYEYRHTRSGAAHSYQ